MVSPPREAGAPDGCQWPNSLSMRSCSTKIIPTKHRAAYLPFDVKTEAEQRLFDMFTDFMTRDDPDDAISWLNHIGISTELMGKLPEGEEFNLTLWPLVKL